MDPSSSAPVQKDDESYDLSMSIDILKNVVRNYSPEPLEKLVTPRLTSKPLMLKAFLDLDYPGYQKIMVGDGPMLETYQKQYPEVTFTGFKTGVDLARYYANAEVFVFPSRWETFGIVMIEAMACGTPVAAFPCDGPMDVIDQAKTGYLSEDLSSAIDQCLELDRTRVELGSQRWSWQQAWQIFQENLVEKQPRLLF